MAGGSWVGSEGTLLSNGEQMAKLQKIQRACPVGSWSAAPSSTDISALTSLGGPGSGLSLSMILCMQCSSNTASPPDGSTVTAICILYMFCSMPEECT